MAFWEMFFAAMAILLGLFMGRGFSISLMLPMQFFLMVHSPNNLPKLNGKQVDKSALKTSPTATMLSLVFMIGFSILTWYLIHRYRAPLAWWYFGAFVFSFLVAMQRNLVSLNEQVAGFADSIKQAEKLEFNVDRWEYDDLGELTVSEEFDESEVEEIESLMEEFSPEELEERLVDLRRKLAEKERREKK